MRTIILMTLGILPAAVVFASDGEAGGMDILTWLINNIEAVVAGATLVLGGLAIIAKLTPSPKDDKWVAKLLAFFKLLPKKQE